MTNLFTCFNKVKSIKKQLKPKTGFLLSSLLLLNVHHGLAQNASFDNDAIPVPGGVNNSAFGRGALQVNIGGTDNTALGWQSLFNNNFSSYNTGIGSQSLFGNNGGFNNTAVGALSLFNNSLGNSNSAFGYGADVASGSLNNATAIGSGAIVNFSDAIQLGDGNVTQVFVGTGTNATLITGGLQVLGGSLAAGKVLTSNASGVATWQSLPSWGLTGNSGTVDGTNFIGTTDNVPFTVRVNNQRAGRIDQINNHTFWGYQSGNLAATGFNLAAFGRGALSANTTGYGNTAIGTWSLTQNTTGTYNTALGADALGSNLTGDNNTALGGGALGWNNIGSYNTSIGFNSMYNNFGGTYNCAMGINALGLVTSGTGNVGMGCYSMDGNDGSYNTGLGYNTDITASSLSNSTAIGNGAVVGVSNKIRFGNAAVTIVEGPVAYTTSDARFKSNIREDDVKGLDFIKRLRPVVYNFEARKFQEFQIKDVPDSVRSRYMNSDFDAATKIRQSGFIAQEVEQAALETGYDFNGVHKPENNSDYYSLSYSQFVVPLVKAVQEQQKMIEAQQKTIEELKAALNVNSSNKNQVTGTPQHVELSDNKAIVLNQNVPNPFAENTVITYNIPNDFSKAQIIFSSTDGQLIRTVEIKTKGKGQLNVFADDLSSGVYHYSLVVDGKTIETRSMIKN